ncbi:MAG: tetratricopeptide repeat protein [Phycisphaerales bacterium]
MQLRALVVVCVGTLGLMGCQSPPRSAAEQRPAKLVEGLGNHSRPVTTKSREAQRYFDQGLTWAYAFNHDEAIRCFTEAARLDPSCAMAWWGVALCHGPHINNPMMPPARSIAAWEAVQKARALEGGATPVERALIRAVAKRYDSNPQADRGPLDAAYADAMVALHKAHPDDADIAMLAAESLMDLQPWDLWTRGGEPKGRAMEIVSLIEAALRLNPRHPGALHLHIHAVEASNDPGRAVASADRLRTLVPAAGHLVHMPAHIDVRTGRWDQACAANERAIRADDAHRRATPAAGFYRVYMAHNHHFLAYAAMMDGRYKVALQAAREMIANIPPEFIRDSAAMVDPYTAIEYQVLLRFGKWKELLAAPAPDNRLPVTGVMWRFARASAYAATGEVAAARSEQSAFQSAVKALPEGTMMAINPAKDVIAIAELVLEGEIAFRERKADDAVRVLREAAELEDQLKYMEPPEWIQPARHSLAAILLSAGRAGEAEAVYREDLKRWPENGWALFGLSEALRAQGRTADADAAAARFERAWVRADTRIHASCLCVK